MSDLLTWMTTIVKCLAVTDCDDYAWAGQADNTVTYKAFTVSVVKHTSVTNARLNFETRFVSSGFGIAVVSSPFTRLRPVERGPL